MISMMILCNDLDKKNEKWNNQKTLVSYVKVKKNNEEKNVPKK